MSDGGILFSVHCFLGGFGSLLFVLSLYDSVANVGDGGGMPREPVVAHKKVFGQHWEEVYGGIGVGCKTSKFISFIIALVNVCVAPKFVSRSFICMLMTAFFRGLESLSFFWRWL